MKCEEALLYDIMHMQACLLLPQVNIGNPSVPHPSLLKQKGTGHFIGLNPKAASHKQGLFHSCQEWFAIGGGRDSPLPRPIP